MKPMAVVLACAAVFGTCAALFAGAVMTRDQRLFDELRERIDRYVDVRNKGVEAIGGLESSVDPARIVAQRRLLQTEIRRRRAGAKHGDIFQPDIRVYIREILRPVVRGERGEDIRARLNDDAPEADAVPLEVNAAYPAGLPLPSTPWPLLAALPTLPNGLTYRVIGRDLILLDEPADLIIDYMRNVLPPRVGVQ